MNEIKKQKKTCIPIFSDKDDDLSSLRWRLDKYGYARTTINNKPEKPIVKFAHHFVCERSIGRRPDWSKREVCDHIDRNKMNNRRENLRIVSIYENSKNRDWPEDMGATFHKKTKKWQSQITYKGKSFYCGLYNTREEAVSAAKNKKITLENKEESQP